MKDERKTRMQLLEELNALRRQLAASTDDAPFLEQSPLGILVYQDDRFVVVNPALEEMTGRTGEELLALSRSDMDGILHPEDRTIAWERLTGRFQGKPLSSPHRFRIVRPDGGVLPVEAFSNTTVYQGRPAVQVYLVDITERWRTEEALQASEEKYRNLAENANEAIFVARHGQILYINPKSTEIAGYSREEFLSRSFLEFIHPDDQGMVVERHLQRLTGEVPASYTYPFRIITKSGTVKWVELNGVRIDWEGEPATLNFLSDITGRRMAEEALRESEGRLRALFDSIEDFVFIKDADRRYALVNAFFRKRFGIEDVRFLGKKDQDIDIFDNPGDTIHTIEETDTRVLAGECVEYELTHRIQETCITFHVIKTPIRDEEGSVAGICGISRDVTERRRIEESLRISEENYRHIFEHAAEGIFQSTPDGRYLQVNPALARMCGYETPEEMVHDVTNIATQVYMDPLDREHFKENLEREGVVRNFEFRIRRIDGDVFWVSMNANCVRDPFGRILCYEGIMENIHARRQAEDALRESQQRLADIISFLPDATLAIDTDRKVIVWNRAIEEMTGIPASEMIGRGDYAYTIPFYGERRPLLMDLVWEDNTELEALYSHVRRDGNAITAEVFSPTLYGGRGAHIFLKASPLHDRDGRIIGAIESIRDISERKRMEEIQQQSEERYRTIIENIEDGYFEVDLAGNFVFFNESMRKIMGFEPEEMPGLNYRKFADEENVRKAYRIFDGILRTGAPVSRFESEIVRKDGDLRTLEMSASLIRDGEGNPTGFRGVARDTTDRKRAEEAIREMAYHDPLTGLPNRKLFTDRLEMALARAEREEGVLAVLMMDLDRFKDINDTLGHSVGDELLIAVGSRLKGLFRRVDTVARFGGDEFVILLPEVRGDEDTLWICQKAVEAIREPFICGNHVLEVTTSIGAALYPSHGTDMNMLLRNADVAMYKAKRAGRNRCAFFSG
ncbi:MAG: PAS domain S-box protein [Syntrophaceae bacterium]|nr:PAS domain S-box protein [Syntrophaceae bacterium]